MAALASLAFRRNAQDVPENRSGTFVFSGEPHRYHEWHFRTLFAFGTSREEDRPATIRKIVEGLRGDMLNIAMDFGYGKLMEDGSLDMLIQAIHKFVFPSAEAEAKSLFEAGTRPGTLDRAHDESVQNYVSRRRRWWRTVRNLDPSISLSDKLLGQMLLDHATLSNTEKLLVLTSTNNRPGFDGVAAALERQHPLLHQQRRGLPMQQTRRFKGSP